MVSALVNAIEGQLSVSNPMYTYTVVFACLCIACTLHICTYVRMYIRTYVHTLHVHTYVMPVHVSFTVPFKVGDELVVALAAHLYHLADDLITVVCARR